MNVSELHDYSDAYLNPLPFLYPRKSFLRRTFVKKGVKVRGTKLLLSIYSYHFTFFAKIKTKCLYLVEYIETRLIVGASKPSCATTRTKCVTK